jgi:putative addiction module CopG family antidote
MRVELPPELEELVRRRMASGHYDSPFDVVREALQLLETYDELGRRRNAAGRSTKAWRSSIAARASPATRHGGARWPTWLR